MRSSGLCDQKQRPLPSHQERSVRLSLELCWPELITSHSLSSHPHTHSPKSPTPLCKFILYCQWAVWLLESPLTISSFYFLISKLDLILPK